MTLRGDGIKGGVQGIRGDGKFFGFNDTKSKIFACGGPLAEKY